MTPTGETAQNPRVLRCSLADSLVAFAHAIEMFSFDRFIQRESSLKA